MKRILSAVLACVLLVGCVFVLASCGGPNADPEKAEAALKEEGYTVMAIPSFGIAGVEKSISAYKIIDEETEKAEGVYIFYLSEDADADKAYEEIEKLYNEAKEEDEDIDFKIGKADGMIWFGTAAAIKAAK